MIPPNEEASAVWHISVKDPDEAKVGRAFSNAVAELALSSIPGYFGIGGGPVAGRSFGIYEPARVPADIVPQEVVILGGETRFVDSVIPDAPANPQPAAGPNAQVPDGPTRRAPLGAVVGARSGDKGGNANCGIWAKTDESYAFLYHYLTVEEFKRLFPA